jgi:hypothetical protein
MLIICKNRFYKGEAGVRFTKRRLTIGDAEQWVSAAEVTKAKAKTLLKKNYLVAYEATEQGASDEATESEGEPNDDEF